MQIQLLVYYISQLLVRHVINFLRSNYNQPQPLQLSTPPFGFLTIFHLTTAIQSVLSKV